MPFNPPRLLLSVPNVPLTFLACVLLRTIIITSPPLSTASTVRRRASEATASETDPARSGLAFEEFRLCETAGEEIHSSFVVGAFDNAGSVVVGRWCREGAGGGEEGEEGVD